MGAPLEKVYSYFSFPVRVRQVLDVDAIGEIDKGALHFIPWPASASSYQEDLSNVAKELPLSIRVEVTDWYFIKPGGRSWPEYLETLKPSHAKKIRRYGKQPEKCGYSVKVEDPEHLDLATIERCYDLLCQTMLHNGDRQFYTKESFAQHLRSQPVLLASSGERILGFYSGAVIGHDHDASFRSYSVYHNLFIEHVKRGFEEGEEMVDLGNAGDDFKRELGAEAFRLVFSLRAARSFHGALGLTLWAAHSWLEVLLHFREWPLWAQCAAALLLVFLLWCRVSRWLDTLNALT
ncbi:TY5A [Symbiodinium natans]|uniref:TY5A protein n=1 Tax=Symbiodinium natans TaxID=878477 RepID=A0A812Q810_9DINO|nr:TY5A [Symbiodinium natans]